MAIWYAQASGNLSALTYDSLPGGGGSTTSWAAMPETDSVEANGFSVTIDVVGWTRAGLSTANGGGFRYVLAGENTITCDIAAGTSTGLTIESSSADLTVVGDVIGGTASSARGIYLTAAGDITVIGDVMGGSAGLTYGIRNDEAGLVTVNGAVMGGSGSTSIGVVSQGAGNTVIVGTVTGGTGTASFAVNNTGTGLVTITGTLVFDQSNNAPLGGKNYYFNFGSVEYYKAPGDGPYTLEDTTPQGLFPKQTLFP